MTPSMLAFVRSTTVSILACAWMVVAWPHVLAAEPTALQAREAPTDETGLLHSNLEPALEYSRKNQGAAVLIMKDGEIVLEQYQNGRKASEPGYIASGTKAFWGPAIAAMIEDGLVSSFDERVADTITEWEDDRLKSRMTVRHLLSMTSGLREDMQAIGGERGTAHDKYAVAISLPAAGPPGRFFRYGPAHFFSLGAFMERKLAPLDLTPLEYLDERILDRIGVEYGEWKHDPSGNPHLPNGAYLTARDWARYGQFIAQLGRWGDEQIVRQDLIEECLEPSEVNPAIGLTIWLNRPGGYGFLDIHRAPAGAPGGFMYPWGYPEMAGAMGGGKNRLYMLPTHDLVIVRQAIGRRDDYIDSEFLALVLAGFQETDTFAIQGAPVPSTDKANRVRRIFRVLDRDNDGFVSREEIPAERSGLLNNFDRLDADGDGRLSVDELSFLMERRSQ